jgi:hypothetical protein
VGPDNPNYRPNYILDLTDGQRYELTDLDRLPRLDGDKFNPKYYAYFQSAGQVFLHHTEYTAIALAPDFRQHHERNVIISEGSLGLVTYSEEGKLLEQLMKDLGVDYESVDLSLQYADIPSPMGRYIVRNDGIYLYGINKPVVARDMGWYFKGWYYDESGVIFQERASYLIKFPETQGHYPIPTPILKLRLPVQ